MQTRAHLAFLTIIFEAFVIMSLCGLHTAPPRVRAVRQEVAKAPVRTIPNMIEARETTMLRSTDASPIEELLSGLRTEFVASHERSQYSTQGGASSCGLAALNCARIILGKERSGIRAGKLLHTIVQPETFEEILGLCSSWPSPTYLDVEDIYQIPIVRRSMNMITSNYGKTSLDHFTRLLRSLQETATSNGFSACAVITRPPEIISCFCISLENANIFVIFDSHSRPIAHPQGAAFVCYCSLDAVALYIFDLLHYDRSILEDDLQWQAQLLGMFSGHIFVWKELTASDNTRTGAALTEGLQALYSNSGSSAMNSGKSHSRRELPRHRGDASFGPTNLTNPYAYHPLDPSHGQASRPEARNTEQSNDRILSFRDSHTCSHDDSSHSGRTRSTRQAYSLQCMSGSTNTVSSTSSKLAGPLAKDGDLFDLDLQLALEEQRICDEEHLRLLEEREWLARSTPQVFTCGKCLDSFSNEFVAEVTPCRHHYCRKCIQFHVLSELNSRHFPILCPLCKADRHLQTPSVLDHAFIQQVGLSEAQYAIFVEMEMGKFAIAVRCKSCRDSFYVDRGECEESNIITCPLPRCRRSWCKSSNQLIQPGQPEHPCDGSNGRRHLVGERGWRLTDPRWKK